MKLAISNQLTQANFSNITANTEYSADRRLISKTGLLLRYFPNYSAKSTLFISSL